MSKKYVYPQLGRAGLGNELFPYLRAMDRSTLDGMHFVPPRWFKFRVGPYLRGERDKRSYWKIFKAPDVRQCLRRAVLDVSSLTVKHVSTKAHVRNQVVDRPTGVGAHFQDLRQGPITYLDQLRAAAKTDALSALPTKPYVAVHVRLGDFSRVIDPNPMLMVNNTSAPLSWYKQVLQQLRSTCPDVPILIASDGSDHELRSLLELEAVDRTSPKNALDDIFLLAGADGIVGSRSTFTAWAAYLGQCPLLLPPGGNAYHPHESVWEASRIGAGHPWLQTVQTSTGCLLPEPGS